MMRIITFSIAIIGLLLFTGCNNGTSNTDGNTNQPTINQPSDTTTTIPTNQPHQHTLAELSATIKSAGTFLEDWWSLGGRFDWSHVDYFSGEPLPEH